MPFHVGTGGTWLGKILGGGLPVFLKVPRRGFWTYFQAISNQFHLYHDSPTKYGGRSGIMKGPVF